MNKVKKISLFDVENLESMFEPRILSEFTIMKYLYILLFCCGVSMVSGQEQIANSDAAANSSRRIQGQISYRDTVPDSSLRIVDYDTLLTCCPISAKFINGKYFQESICRSLDYFFDKHKVESLNVSREDTVINDILYKSKIYITVGGEFNIKEISLSAIKKKYTELKDYPAVFIIDGEIVTRDYDAYVIDEDAILTITTGNIKKPEVAFISILTKTEANLKERNTFRLCPEIWYK